MSARVQFFAGRLLRLAWPVTLARLGVMGMGLCDMIVVGQLAAHELPHQALAWAPTGVLMVSGIGMLLGVQVLAARAIGAGQPRAAGAAWRAGMVISLVTGMLATLGVWLSGTRLFDVFGIAPGLADPAARVTQVLVLSVPLHLLYVTSAFFCEAIQRPMPSTLVMCAANIVNLVLNLVWVPRFGAVGSAWATVGARFVLAVALLAWVLGFDGAAEYGTRSRGHRVQYTEFLRVGAAAALSQAVEAGAFSGMTIIAGRLGSEAVAAYQILLNSLAVVFMIALGLATATTVLTSEAIGRAAPADAARASWTGLVLICVSTLCVAALFCRFPWQIARSYTADAMLAHAVSLSLPLTAAVLLPDGAQAVLAAGLRAHRDNWFPTASHVLAYACVMPLIAVVLAERQNLGVTGLLLAILAASVLSASVLALRLWRVTGRAPAS